MAQPPTSTVLMVAFVSALGVSAATIVGLRRPAMPRSTAPDTETRLTWIRAMAAIVPARMNFMGRTAPFHQLATAAIAMGIPLWTQTVQTDACATVRKSGPAVTARFHRSAMPGGIALDTGSQMMMIRSMAAPAIAVTATVGRTVPFHQLATRHFIALDTEAQVMMIQPMAATAFAVTSTVGRTVPFHQLATKIFIAMDIRLWT